MLELTARKNLKLQISDHQLEILVGCILGDGCICSKGKILIAQGSKQTPYLNWKYKKLASLAYGAKPAKVSRFDERTGKIYSQSRFWLRQYFRLWRKVFYPQGKKIFPETFAKYITPLSIAIWYMDDGNYSEGRNVKIATEGFDLESREKLRSLLLRKFNIKSTLHKNGKLRISNESLTRFFDLVSPFIHSSMKYKIP
jgi:recombination protein RecA